MKMRARDGKEVMATSGTDWGVSISTWPASSIGQHFRAWMKNSLLSDAIDDREAGWRKRRKSHQLNHERVRVLPATTLAGITARVVANAPGASRAAQFGGRLR